jgi:hypothetical protein
MMTTKKMIGRTNDDDDDDDVVVVDCDGPDNNINNSFCNSDSDGIIKRIPSAPVPVPVPPISNSKRTSNINSISNSNSNIHIMACGYRRIVIPKSGNLFPAFLIALPIQQVQVPIPLININRQHQHQQQDKIRFVWRSKRDFMILARSSTTNRQSLPKAALKKIVQDDIIPWRRSCCSSTKTIITTTTTPTTITEEINDDNVYDDDNVDNNNIPYFLCDPKLPNKFCPQMKKSLWQLDRFLQMIYTETIAIATTKTKTTTTTTTISNSNSNSNSNNTTKTQTQEQQIDKMKLAWEIFCRPYDTDGLITPKEFFPSTTNTNTNTNTNTIQDQKQKQQQPSTEDKRTVGPPDYNNYKIKNNDERIVIGAVDEQNNINITKTTKTTTAATATATATATTTTSLEESSKLGQYFASKENSKRVVDCALEKIIPLYHEYNNRQQQQQQSRNNNSNSSSSSNSSNINIQLLFIEPSCGHGDIVVALVDALKKRKSIISPQSVSIQGYDIDPNAITTCRQRQEFLLPSTTTSSSSDDDDDDDDDNDSHHHHYHIHWECRNFLETTRQQYIDKFNDAAAAAVNNSNNNNNNNNNINRAIADTCTDAKRSSNRNINNNNNNGDKTLKVLVCCLGGPPYTTGPGHGNKIQRDLPTQFVRHCQEEWSADVITFILPTRYREGMQHNISDCTFTTARTRIKTKRTTTMTDDSATKAAVVTTTTSPSISRDYCTNNNWICETAELNASTFFFRGSTQVTQPSIIQNFYTNRGNERTKC